MDYQQLLIKYMAHVLEREGIDYLEQTNTHRDSVAFTDAELAELERISQEARK